MQNLIFLVVTAIVLLVAFFISYEVYERYCLNRSGKQRSFLLFLGGTLLSGYLGSIVIGSLSYSFFCTSDMDLECDPSITAIAFPLFCGTGIAVYLFVWALAGRRVERT